MLSNDVFDTLFLPWCRAMEHLRLPRAGGEPPDMKETVMPPTLTLFLGNSKQKTFLASYLIEC